MLELGTSVKESFLDIELKGSLDSESAQDFQSWLLMKNEQGRRLFALNCAKLEFISSRGIGTLTDIHKILKSKKANIALYNVSNEVMNLLTFLKIDEIMIIQNSLQDIMDIFKSSEAQIDEVEPVVEPKKEFGSDDTLTENREDLVINDDITGLNAVFGDYSSTFDMDNLQNSSHSVRQPASELESEKERQSNVKTRSRLSADSDQDFFQSRKFSFPGPIVIQCPNCMENLRISTSGEFLCPECRFKFRYP